VPTLSSFPGVIKKLKNGLFKINMAFLGLGMFCLFAIMFIDTVNAVGIKLKLVAIPSGKTLIEEMMAVLVYSGIGYLLFDRGHIKTEAILSRLPKYMKFFSSILSYSVMFVVSGYIFWMNTGTAIYFLKEKVHKIAAIPVPMGPFFVLISLAFLVFSLCAVVFLIDEIFSYSVSQKEN